MKKTEIKKSKKDMLQKNRNNVKRTHVTCGVFMCLSLLDLEGLVLTKFWKNFVECGPTPMSGNLRILENVVLIY